MARTRKSKARKPAKRSAPSLHDKRFPGESTPYREARNALLRSETELRRGIERVATARRKLPLGGPVPVD